MEVKDMDVLEFARKISLLSIETPLANEFDKEYGQKNDRWWSCQREHLIVWCLHFPTSGIGKFIHKPCSSAKKMYNGFSRPETLLWLIEALDFEKSIIRNIIDNIKDISNCKSACKKVRESIPFEKVIDALLKREV